MSITNPDRSVPAIVVVAIPFVSLPEIRNADAEQAPAGGASTRPRHPPPCLSRRLFIADGPALSAHRRALALPQDDTSGQPLPDPAALPDRSRTSGRDGTGPARVPPRLHDDTTVTHPRHSVVLLDRTGTRARGWSVQWSILDQPRGDTTWRLPRGSRERLVRVRTLGRGCSARKRFPARPRGDTTWRLPRGSRERLVRVRTLGRGCSARKRFPTRPRGGTSGQPRRRSARLRGPSRT